MPENSFDYCASFFLWVNYSKYLLNVMSFSAGYRVFVSQKEKITKVFFFRFAFSSTTPVVTHFLHSLLFAIDLSTFIII
jgi:hypothetical protein